MASSGVPKILIPNPYSLPPNYIYIQNPFFVILLLVMKLKKKLIIWPVSGVILIVAVIGFSQRNKGPVYTTVAVQHGDLTQVVEATGSVAAAQDLNLSFRSQGSIGQVLVKVGDQVKKGQTLAIIYDSALSSQVDRARAGVLSAQASLDKLLAGAKTEDIAVSQEKVDKAAIDLDKAKQDLANDLSDQQTATAVYLDTAKQALADAVFVAEYTLSVVYDGILDSDAESDFQTVNSDAYARAKLEYATAGQSVQAAKQSFQFLAAEAVTSEILAALYKMRLALDDCSALVSDSFQAVAGGQANGDFSQTVLDNLETSFNTRASALKTEKTSVQTSISNLSTGLQALASQVGQSQFAVRTAEQALSLAQADQASLTAAPESYEIQQAQAVVLQAQADLKAAESKFSDTVITAPLDGLITDLALKVGELAQPNQTVLKIIGQNDLQIDVDIPEADISQLAVDQPATITLDAFGLDKKFAGHVTFIEPSERIIQDVVYYRLTVLFDQEEADIKPGMTADVSILTAEKKNVLTLPLRAVIVDKTGSRSVRLLVNNKVEERVVTTGIRGEDGQVEILSGLSEGELVITGESGS